MIESETILFTDIVGSTELSQRVMPDAADDVRCGHCPMLSQASAEVGATEVGHRGDGLRVGIGPVSAAMARAAAMPRGVERDNREWGYPVGLRREASRRRHRGTPSRRHRPVDRTEPVTVGVDALSTPPTPKWVDNIATGTPSGTGIAHQPPLWMGVGHGVRVDRERVGSLRSPIIEESETRAVE